MRQPCGDESGDAQCRGECQCHIIRGQNQCREGKQHQYPRDAHNKPDEIDCDLPAGVSAVVERVATCAPKQPAARAAARVAPRKGLRWY